MSVRLASEKQDKGSRVDQKSPALSLFCQEYAEDKLAGIQYLQEVLLPAGGLDCQ